MKHPIFQAVADELQRFQRLFTRYLTAAPQIDWEKIEPLPKDTIRDYASLNAPSDDEVKSMLAKLVVVKLNGGLGTSMGCQGPKSAISVRNDLTFLDLTVQQIEVPREKRVFECGPDERSKIFRVNSIVFYEDSKSLQFASSI